MSSVQQTLLLLSIILPALFLVICAGTICLFSWATTRLERAKFSRETHSTTEGFR